LRIAWTLKMRNNQHKWRCLVKIRRFFKASGWYHESEYNVREISPICWERMRKYLKVSFRFEAQTRADRQRVSVKIDFLARTILKQIERHL